LILPVVDLPHNGLPSLENSKARGQGKVSEDQFNTTLDDVRIANKLYCEMLGSLLRANSTTSSWPVKPRRAGNGWDFRGPLPFSGPDSPR